MIERVTQAVTKFRETKSELKALRLKHLQATQELLAALKDCGVELEDLNIEL